MAELPDAKYGENKEYEAQQKVMPASQAQTLPPTPPPSAFEQGQAPGPLDQGPPLGLFNAPTERPNEPVTAGAPMGPGPNTLAMGPQAPTQPMMLSRTLAQYGTADPSGVIAELAQYLDGMNI